jgi:RNA polymerase sigma-70 factor (ECF subfamily)
MTMERASDRSERGAMPVSSQQRPAESVLPHRDSERLGALLTSLEPRLNAVALRFTRDPEVARDVVQSAFEKVVRHAASFRGHARVSTWIHRIVANEALMWLRSERRRSAWYIDDRDDRSGAVVDPSPGPAEALSLRRREQRLRDGLSRLTRDERDVVRCCALAGQSYAEYGARTGTHPAAVKSRAFRARQHLSLLLGES